VINIVSWNIQCCRGVDGIIDYRRIASVIKEFGDIDIICLQEVARHDPELDDGKAQDQKQILAQFFPEYEGVFGAALSRRRKGDKHRRAFGNMILSRLPVVQQFNHALPQPAPPSPCKNMARQALEIVVEAQSGPFRLTTTHLEFFSPHQRLAQIDRLREIQIECSENAEIAGTEQISGPYARILRPVNSIICGDFNSLPDDEVYSAMTKTTDKFEGYLDAWSLVFPHRTHTETCGVFDVRQWPEGPHCRDFFFLTQGLKSSIHSIEVNLETAASDHQPVLLTMSC
jgi:endonuclease/exonuclease/phosphatase family metal-dependent hydrolase